MAASANMRMDVGVVPSVGTRLAPAELPGAMERFMRSAECAERAFQALQARVEQLNGELEESNRKLRGKVAELDRLSGHLLCLLDSLGDGVVAVDSSGTIGLFNPAMETLTGTCAQAWVGRALCDMLPVGSRLLTLARDALQGRTGLPRVSVRLARSGGEQVPVSVTAACVRNRSGLAIGAVLVLQNLTEAESLHAQVRQNADLAAIGRTAAMIAHEIRNPLGGIMGFTELLQSDLASDPKHSKYAEMIGVGLGDINAIVGGLLDFSKTVKLQPQDLDLRELLVKLCDLALADLRWSRTSLQLVLQAPPEGLRIHADGGVLRQAFLNLIRNALEAMAPQGRGQLRVRIARSTLDGFEAALVEVGDTGPGIPKDRWAEVFQPFVTTKQEGTGLGLPTVAKLVQAHAGKVECLEEPGGGACFRVVLPLNVKECVWEADYADRARTGR